MHNIGNRSPKVLKKTLKVLRHMVGKEELEELLWENPMRLIDGEEVIH